MELAVKDDVTTNNLGCDEDQVPFVEGYINDCINTAAGEVNRKLKNLAQDIGDNANHFLQVAERGVCQGLSNVKAEFDRYALTPLLESLDFSVNCITSSADALKYIDKIQEIVDQIDDVIDLLPITDTGEFSFDQITDGLDVRLTKNLDSYFVQATDILGASKFNMLKSLFKLGEVNPERFY